MTVSQVLWIWVAMLAPLHEFPDGHIERTVSVIVDDAEIIVEYGIGLSDETATMLIEQAKLIEKAKLIETTRREPEPTTDSGPLDAAVVDSGEIPSCTPFEPEEVSDVGKQVLSAEGTPREQQEKTSRLLADALRTQIPQQLELHLNGERMPLKIIDAVPSPRHHVNLLVRMRAEQPASEGLQITLIDHNFADNSNIGSDGNVRTALRARGNTAILSSDVAKVMVRAAPVAIADFPRNPDSSISLINAKILVTKPAP